LSNGQGGLDWAGLPLACAYLGVDGDPGALIDRLAVIKCHRPHQPAESTSTPPAPTTELE